MTLRRIQLSAVAVVLFMLLLGSGLVQPTGSVAAGRNAGTTKAAPATTWTFEGCWTFFSAGPCRDVFRDEQDNFWICRACGTTGTPSPSKCSPISQATLNIGFWCS